jgi:ketosteroid isomerase-like protein
MRYVVVFLLAFSSCRMFSHEDENISARSLQEMQQADTDFSNYSHEHGMRKAFLEYIDDDGIMMRDNSLPVIGAHAIDYITSMNDSSIELTWEPRGGDIAASGDMGYTYGVYVLKDSVNVQKGTYVTIWKKQADGKWKFVLDSGNQGIGE